MAPIKKITNLGAHLQHSHKVNHNKTSYTQNLGFLLTPE